MYWSVVDIVDSIVGEAGHKQLMMISPVLKDDLYTILRYDLDETVELFKRYTYPDVGREQRPAFVRELIKLLNDRRDLLPDFNYHMLKGLLQIAERLESLPFLEDEEANVLIDEFSTFYMTRICLFKNSTHILDIEESIMGRITEESYLDDGVPVQNFQFVDSKDSIGVQVADVVAGLLGKCFTFLNRTTMEELTGLQAQFSPLQSCNLSLLSKLMDISLDENSAFGNYVASHEDHCRRNFLLGL